MAPMVFPRYGGALFHNNNSRSKNNRSKASSIMVINNLSSHLRTTLLVALVVLLSAVFVLQFGGNQSSGCSSSSNGPGYAARVDGEQVTLRAFRATYALASYGLSLDQQKAFKLRQLVADGLVDRLLLAEEARNMGITITEEEMLEAFGKDGIVRMTIGQEAPYYLPPGTVPTGGGREYRIPIRDKDGQFDTDTARGFIENSLGLSIGAFSKIQVQEALAQKMRETIAASIAVSDTEAWDTYVREKNRAKIQYFRFRPSYYETSINLTNAEISAWRELHSEDIDREYERDIRKYTQLEPQVRARHILIKASTNATEEEKTEARARAEALLKRARAGADFEALAREHSEDDGSASKGGDLGFNTRGTMVAAFDEAQFAMEVNTISDIVASTFGYHIIQVIGKREGDVPVDEAKRDIAEKLLRTERAQSMALAAATSTLESLKQGTSMNTLDRRFAGLPDAPPALPEGEEEDMPVRAPRSPQREESDWFGAGDSPIRGLPSDKLAQTVLELAQEDENKLIEAPLQLANEFVVYRVSERERATREDWAGETRDRIRSGLQSAREREALQAHLQGLRAPLEAANKITIAPQVLLYGDEPEPGTNSGSDLEPAADAVQGNTAQDNVVQEIEAQPETSTAETAETAETE